MEYIYTEKGLGILKDKYTQHIKYIVIMGLVHMLDWYKPKILESNSNFTKSN